MSNRPPWTREQLLRARSLRTDGKTYAQIATELNCAVSTVFNYLNGKGKQVSR